MNVNKMLLSLADVTGLSVVPDLYEGKAQKWITFSYTDERVSLYGDDEEEAVTVTLNVILYTPVAFNYFTLKKKIKRALHDLGFQLEYIQSYVQDTMDGTDRIRQTIFHVTYTGVDD